MRESRRDFHSLSTAGGVSPILPSPIQKGVRDFERVWHGDGHFSLAGIFVRRQSRCQDIPRVSRSSDLSGSVPHVEYSLANPQGFAALNLLRVIVQWGRQTFD